MSSLAISYRQFIPLYLFTFEYGKSFVCMCVFFNTDEIVMISDITARLNSHRFKDFINSTQAPSAKWANKYTYINIFNTHIMN